MTDEEKSVLSWTDFIQFILIGALFLLVLVNGSITIDLIDRISDVEHQQQDQVEDESLRQARVVPSTVTGPDPKLERPSEPAEDTPEE